MVGAMTEDPTWTELTFDDLDVISAEDVDAFSVNWNTAATPPPYYFIVDGRRFAYSGETFLINGFGAGLPRWVQEHEAEGRLVMFAEREDRLLAYVHDPAAEAEDDEDEGEAEAASE